MVFQDVENRPGQLSHLLVKELYLMYNSLDANYELLAAVIASDNIDVDVISDQIDQAILASREISD